MNEYEHDRKAIIAANPLLEYCMLRGWKLRHVGREWKCLCPLHEERTPSFTIDPAKNLFHCFGCGAGGSVIDLHAALGGIAIGEAMRELSPGGGNGAPGPPYHCGHHIKTNRRPTSEESTASMKPSTAPPTHEVAAYDYHDATGRVRFQVVRYEYVDAETKETRKAFKQCQVVNGARVWNMDGVERLPYRLPELLAAPASTWIVEGEKDVETLRAIGQTATCNPGGAGKWLPAFSQHLKGQCVYICADRDDVGQKHGRQVLKALEGIVEWAKWVELPPDHNGKPVKDVTDLREACKTSDEFVSVLERLQRKAQLIEGGIDSRAFTMLELEAQYIAERTEFDGVCLSLNRWLPELKLRALGPGDLLGIMAHTGQCKTAAVQNILACNADIAGVIFELELSGPQMFERAAAISTCIDAWKISENYDRNFHVDWKKPGKFKNLLTCTASLSMAEIDVEIGRASAKLGCLPRLFVIDYAQLVRGSGTRYERMSATCEEAKRLAKKWNAIGIIVSQVSRPKDGDEYDAEVNVYDAKESGSFENSCGLVLGVWKTAKTELKCRVLKNTRGGSAGREVAAKLVANTYIIEPA